MKMKDEKVRFNVLEAMKHSIEDRSLFCIDLLSDLMNNFSSSFLDVFSTSSSSLDFYFSDMSYMMLDNKENYKIGEIKDVMSPYDTRAMFECDVEVAENTLGSTMLPFVEMASTLELKPLPSLLKYDYLGKDGNIPVIIFCLA